MYSEEDLRDAAEFRAGIHAEAFAKARLINPKVEAVVDRHPVEAYLTQRWEYPGAWYTYAGLPEGFETRTSLVDAIVARTLMKYSRS